jgi:AcrR family transcriptional regulator
MQRRAEQVDETRQRIVEAAVRLHTSIGASRASLSAVAEEAGVTRVTLYRHFPTLDDLYAACRSHWRAQNPPPDAALWLKIPAFEDRVRSGLTDLYGWYRQHGDELYPIYRDVPTMPDLVQTAMRNVDARMVSVIIEGAMLTRPIERRVRAALGHAVAFWTWRSLAVDQGLPNEDCVDLATGLVLAASTPRAVAPPRARQARRQVPVS